jgi:hypothetical protein
MKNKISAFLTAVIMLSTLTACRKELTKAPEESSAAKLPSSETVTEKPTEKPTETTIETAAPDSKIEHNVEFTEYYNTDDPETGDKVLVYKLSSEKDTPGITEFNKLTEEEVYGEYENFLEFCEKYDNRRKDIGKSDKMLIEPFAFVDNNYAQVLYKFTQNIDDTDTGILTLTYDINSDKVITVEDALKTAENLPNGVSDLDSLEEYLEIVYPTTEDYPQEYIDENIQLKEADNVGFLMPCEETDNRLLLYFYAEYEDIYEGNPDNTGSDIDLYATYEKGFIVYDVTNGTMKLVEEKEAEEYDWFS